MTLKRPTKQWYVYMIRCKDGSLYTGITNNLARRLRAHRAGKGARYTRSRGVVGYVYHLPVPNKPIALQGELRIKRMSKAQKEALCG